MIKKYLPLTIITLVHIISFLYASQTLNIYLKDSYEYLFVAKNLASHFTIYSGDLNRPILDHLISLRPPVYGYFIALIKLFFDAELAICFVQSILSLWTIFILSKIIILLFNSSHLKFLLISFVLFPSQFVYANMIMSEILFQFLILLFIYQHILFFKTGRFSFLLFANFILCLLVLTKPVALVLLVFYILYVSIMILNKKLAISVLAYPLFAVACLLSYQYYNFTKTGYFHYTSITSTYLLNYQLGKTLQSEYSEAKVEEIIFNINQEAEKEKSFKDYSNKRILLTLQELNHHKIQFFKLTAIGIINFFIDPGRWDMNRYINQHNKPAYYILMLYSLLIAAFNALLFILFLYAFTLIKSNNNVLLLLILVVISIALATGITGSARFKLPVYPLLIVIALFSLQSTRLKALSSRFNLKTNLRIIL